MSQEPIGCPYCGGNDHNADECKRFAGEREAFDEWYPTGCPGAGVTAKLSALAGFRAGAQWQARAAQPAPARCEYCDGTGDVHSLDGEWRGSCICQVIGLPPAQPAPVVPERYRLVKVSDQGVQFGNAWFSHESITGKGADQLNSGECGVTGRAYMDWLAAAPSQGQQVECQECERLRDKYQRDVYGLNNEGDPIGGEPVGGYANDNARLRAELAALKAQQSEDSETVRRICDLFGIGSKARTQAAIMASVENTHKFARMLDAIESEFFMVPGEIDPDYPDDQPYDCLVNRWSSTPEQYVEQFRGALETLKAQKVGQEDVAALNSGHIAPAQDVAGLVGALRELIEFAEPALQRLGFGYMGKVEKARRALAAHDKQSGVVK